MYTNLPTSQGYIFRILQHFVTKLCSFSNFDNFFPEISFVIPRLKIFLKRKSSIRPVLYGRISVSSNAIQTIDNETTFLIIYCLNSIRRDRNSTKKCRFPLHCRSLVWPARAERIRFTFAISLSNLSAFCLPLCVRTRLKVELRTFNFLGVLARMIFSRSVCCQAKLFRVNSSELRKCLFQYWAWQLA